ncbi:MAG: septal ring lytic transglycosylase RlpA family protein [Acidobacteriales bacterium]|nr:septal ring lytic transglycosylase RlpA family protein [Terriglobales bacterium]
MQRSLATILAAALLLASIAAAQAPSPAPVKKEATGVQKPQEQPAQPATPKKPAQPRSKKAKAEVGVASWYGGSFNGRATASGQQFDMNQLTAAHPTLPLGTLIKVTNLRNGKFVVLRVNDRGPYVENRIVDVSYYAARHLEFSDRGIARVKIETVGFETLAANKLTVTTE